MKPCQTWDFLIWIKPKGRTDRKLQHLVAIARQCKEDEAQRRGASEFTCNRHVQWLFLPVLYVTEAPPTTELQYFDGCDRWPVSQLHLQAQGDKLTCPPRNQQGQCYSLFWSLSTFLGQHPFLLQGVTQEEVFANHTIPSTGQNTKEENPKETHRMEMSQIRKVTVIKSPCRCQCSCWSGEICASFPCLYATECSFCW